MWKLAYILVSSSGQTSHILAVSTCDMLERSKLIGATDFDVRCIQLLLATLASKAADLSSNEGGCRHAQGCGMADGYGK